MVEGFVAFASNPVELSVTTLTSLLFSFLFTRLHQAALKLAGASARIYLFFALTFLFFFVINFVLFLIFFFKIEDIKRFFLSPRKVFMLSAMMLFLSYVCSLMHQYTSNLFGQFVLVTWLFFSLSLFFLLIFAITFVALVLAIMNRILSRNI
jgi:hypothetical protein